MSENEQAEQPLRVGVVGLGFAGTTHTRSYQQVPGVEVVGLAGLEEERLAEMGEEYRIPHLYAQWEDLLARDDLDVVSVCTPNFLHAPIAIAALQGGRHVLCEKPLARNAAEAQAMVDAATAAGRVLHTAFNHRERGDVQTLKSFVDEGLLGRVYYAKAYWMRRNGIPGLGSWFTSKELAGGGPLIDLGVHALDQALYLMGEPEITSVSATTYAEFGPRGRGMRTVGNKKMQTGNGYEVEDLATAYMRTADGATLLLEASWMVQELRRRLRRDAVRHGGWRGDRRAALRLGGHPARVHGPGGRAGRDAPRVGARSGSPGGRGEVRRSRAERRLGRTHRAGRAEPGAHRRGLLRVGTRGAGGGRHARRVR